MDITTWLRSLDLGEYATAFRNAEIDFEVLPDLSEGDLAQLGLPLGHRKRILKAIERLRSNVEVATLPPLDRARAHPNNVERRQLTVMFCDLVGSTGLVTRLDPEDMSEIIRSYHQVVGEAVTQFDGTVTQLLGDGSLVLFGHPTAHEDDAERAVRAGLVISEAVRALGLGIGVPLEVRVGIATGVVVVGDMFGSGEEQERGVVGETPNLAARLQALAGPGEVVVSDTTRRLLATAFDLRALGLQVLKGFDAPVGAWRVSGEIENVTRFEASRFGSTTPFVGREEEMACLAACWQTASNGDGQALFLTGDAGIGKSRVLAALREQLNNERVVVLRYQCSPHHVNTPLYPLTMQIKHAAGFATSDTVDVKLEKLTKMAQFSRLDGPEAVSLIAHLLSLPINEHYPSLDMAPSEIRERTISVLIELFLGLSSTAPVLALCEDVHWIDPTTLDLFGRLVERISQARILLIMTARSGFSVPWTGHKYLTTLSLPRFDARTTLDLINTLTGSKALPSELLDQIVIKTDGVPLFVEELTKSVLESGMLKEKSDSYVLTSTLMPLAIPSTLQDSLTARLDRLAPVKIVAQTGAAIGREFSHRLLEAVSAVKGEELNDALRQLMAAELLYGRGAPPEASYVFKHALVQDAAYSSLLRSSRQRIHADIARTLVDLSLDQADSAPEVIAHHYTEATLAAPAVRYWLAAAELALSRSADREGARYAERGLELIAQLGDDPIRPEIELSLQVARANAALALKGYTAPETIEILTLVKAMLDTGVGNDIQRFSILYGLWAANYVAARIEIAHGLGREYLDVAARNGDPTFLMIGQRLLGAESIAAGRHREGLRFLEQAEEHYDPARHRPLSYRFGQDIGLSVLCHKVWALWFLGRCGEANRLSEQILKELPGHGHATTVAFCTLYGAIFPSVFSREFDRTTRYASELVEYCSSHKMGPHYVVAGRLCVAVSRGMKEPTLQVITVIREELEALHKFGVYVLDSPISAAIADIYLRIGDCVRVQSVLEEAIEFAERSGEVYWLAELLRLNGHVALTQRSTILAEERLTRAGFIAQQQGAVLLELRALSDIFSRLHRSETLENRIRTLVNSDAIDGQSVEVRVARSIIDGSTSAYSDRN